MCFNLIEELRFVREPLFFFFIMPPRFPLPAVMSCKLERFSEEGVSHLPSNATGILQMAQLSS